MIVIKDNLGNVISPNLDAGKEADNWQANNNNIDIVVNDFLWEKIEFNNLPEETVIARDAEGNIIIGLVYQDYELDGTGYVRCFNFETADFLEYVTHYITKRKLLLCKSKS